MSAERITEAWESYERSVLPADAPPLQRLECRRAFYAGAAAMAAALGTLADAGLPPEEEHDHWLRSCRRSRMPCARGGPDGRNQH